MCLMFIGCLIVWFGLSGYKTNVCKLNSLDLKQQIKP